MRCCYKSGIKHLGIEKFNEIQKEISSGPKLGRSQERKFSYNQYKWQVVLRERYYYERISLVTTLIGITALFPQKAESLRLDDSTL